MSTSKARIGYRPDFDAAVAHLQWAYDHRGALAGIHGYIADRGDVDMGSSSTEIGAGWLAAHN